MKPLLDLQGVLDNEIKERMFVCPFKHSDEQLFEYDKLRHIYVQNRQTYKKICKQERAKNRPLSPEAVQFGKETKAMLEKNALFFACDNCKLYKKHSKSIEVIERINVKQKNYRKKSNGSGIFFGISFLRTEAYCRTLDI